MSTCTSLLLIHVINNQPVLQQCQAKISRQTRASIIVHIKHQNGEKTDMTLNVAWLLMSELLFSQLLTLSNLCLFSWA